MELQSRTEGPVVVITLAGKLDAVTAPEYEKRVREMIEGGAHLLVVDLEPLEYISSAGLRALLVMGKLVKARGGNARLAGAQGNVRSVFDMSGFATLFEMTDSVQAALEGMAPA